MGDRNVNQIPFKPRQHYTYFTREPYEDHSLDWKLFMWLVSLDKVENYIYLFIVIWSVLPVPNNAEFSKEFNEETGIMTEIIEELGISGKNGTSYSEILDDYRNSRYNNLDLSRNLVRNAWAELELEDDRLKYQLKDCTLKQKKGLRQMVISRMSSFQSFAEQIEAKQGIEAKEEIEAKKLLELNERLQKQVGNLKKENSQQQAALGNLTNVSWNDDDPNNTKRLISDIEELQDMLSDFTMVQGNDYKVNHENAVSLLREYKCQTKYPSTKANLVLEAVLQHRAIKIILEDAQQHLQNPYSSGNIDPNLILESNIVYTTEKLIEYTELFRNNRNGEDDITRIAPIKIRQHAYSALGCRGFSNEHPLIKTIATKLLKEMDKFRQVLDKETSDELYEQATQVACKVVNIFCFRLKTQALEPTYEFVQAGRDIDIRLMQGAFGGRDEKNLEVEICGFPFIGVFDESNQKVFTRAQVVARPKRSKSWDKKKY